MNADRMMQMVINMVMRQIISRGVNAGIDRLSGGGKPREEMSPEDRQQARAARRTARQGKQAARIARRAGRL